MARAMEVARKPSLKRPLPESESTAEEHRHYLKPKLAHETQGPSLSDMRPVNPRAIAMAQAGQLMACEPGSYNFYKNAPMRMTTRAKARVVRAVFEFLALPAEIRLMIYDLCFDLSSLSDYLTSAHKTNCKKTRCLVKNHHGNHELSTPTVLLLCKQITREAQWVLHNESLYLPHGTLPGSCRSPYGTYPVSISCVISPDLLRNLRSITFSNRDEDTSYMKDQWNDFLGIMGFMKTTFVILAANGGNHNVKEITIDVQNEELDSHMENCLAFDNCFFHTEVNRVLLAMKGVQGLEKVTINGFMTSWLKDAKPGMLLPHNKFHALPSSIRRRIYDFALDWNQASKSLVAHNAINVDARSTPVKTTHSILLLNKFIRDEALAVLHSKKLILTEPPYHTIAPHGQDPNNNEGWDTPAAIGPRSFMSSIISWGTLSQVRDLRLEIDVLTLPFLHKEWYLLLRQLTVKLDFIHNMESLVIVFKNTEHLGSILAPPVGPAFRHAFAALSAMRKRIPSLTVGECTGDSAANPTVMHGFWEHDAHKAAAEAASPPQGWADAVNSFVWKDLSYEESLRYTHTRLWGWEHGDRDPALPLLDPEDCEEMLNDVRYYDSFVM